MIYCSLRNLSYFLFVALICAIWGCVCNGGNAGKDPGFACGVKSDLVIVLNFVAEILKPRFQC